MTLNSDVATFAAVVPDTNPGPVTIVSAMLSNRSKNETLTVVYSEPMLAGSATNETLAAWDFDGDSAFGDIIFTTSTFNASSTNGNSVVYGFTGSSLPVNIVGNAAFAGGTGDTIDFLAGFESDLLTNRSVEALDVVVQYNWQMSNAGGSFTGGSLADTIDGGSGIDTILGDSGDDTLTGGLGVDTIYGDGGNDVIVGEQVDALLDGGGHTPPGKDELQLGANFNDASDVQIINIEKVTLTSTGLNVTLFDQTENLEIVGFLTGASTIIAGSGNDIITGGSGADTLTGGLGFDSISGADGDDIIVGGAGDLLLDGGGHSSKDVLRFEANFSDANDGQIINIEEVGLTVTGLNVNLGLQSEDLVINGFASGASVILAGSGNDTITGGNGADTLTGGSGADTITGAEGADRLTGGLDDDTFVFAAGSSGNSLAAADTITDFMSGFDRIDTTDGFAFALVDGSGFAGTGEADFLTNAATAIALNFVYAASNVAGTSNTWVYVDANDNNVVDSGDNFLVLTGVSSLVALDFI